MMIKRLVFTCLVLLFSLRVFAFPCYVTVVKDNCWKNYKISVMIIDATTNKQVSLVEIPKNEFWARQTFACEPGQQFLYRSTYEPSFWESEKGRVYTSKQYTGLPREIKPMERAWSLSICFPEAFSSIPLPPDAVGNCKCDFSQVPEVPLQ